MQNAEKLFHKVIFEKILCKFWKFSKFLKFWINQVLKLHKFSLKLTKMLTFQKIKEKKCDNLMKFNEKFTYGGKKKTPKKF